MGSAWTFTPLHPRRYPDHPSSLPYRRNNLADVEVLDGFGVDDGLTDTSDQEYGKDIDFFGSDEVAGTPPTKSGCEILEVGYLMYTNNT